MAKDLQTEIRELGVRARQAAHQLSTIPAEKKNAILRAMADELEARIDSLLAANRLDLDAAASAGLGAASTDRLRLTAARIRTMADGIRAVAGLPDPVGEVIREWDRPNGIRIRKLRTPIGVIGIIFESRPNVTSDAAVLCIKTGNAVILRGGSEALSSNTAIAAALAEGGAKEGLPDGALQLVTTRDRDAVRLMAQMDDFMDVIIPRGGKGLIEAVVSSARMPVIKHYDGICAIYVDRAADIPMAVSIVVNAKCQRPGVCNAAETLLVHRAVATAFLSELAPALSAAGVELRADAAAHAVLAALGYPKLRVATDEDWRTEFLELILAVRVVDNLDEAVRHINTCGSHHSDAIVTADESAATTFLSAVDSATVYWNASTRFTDGGEFGFGAEIGISTDKLHARGPMGLEELTSYKYLIRGSGQIRT